MYQWLSRFPIRLKIAQLVMSYKGQDDNWKCIKTKYSPYYLGSKCEKDFSYYFKNKLTIEASTLEEALSWLNTCEYEKNNEKWKHPIEFEKMKKGDCKDYCLWLWRRLVENNHEVLFVSGERQRESEFFQHAWVVLKDNNKEYIIDPLTIYKSTKLDIEIHKEKYIPWLAVSNSFQYYIYGGYVRSYA